MDESMEEGTFPELELRDLRDVLLGGDGAPTHSAAMNALLSAGLVPLLLSLCARQPRSSSLAFECLQRATCVSEAARDQVGLTGFRQMCGFVERDAALASVVTPILLNTANCESVKAAVFGEVSLPTLRRLLALGSRSPSSSIFSVISVLLFEAQAPQMCFDCGVVAWLDT